MSETCPHCGYCPTCKRANQPIAPVAAPSPYVAGYWCVCGVWVAYGNFAHQCYGWRLTQPVWHHSDGSTTSSFELLGGGRQQ